MFSPDDNPLVQAAKDRVDAMTKEEVIAAGADSIRLALSAVADLAYVLDDLTASLEEYVGGPDDESGDPEATVTVGQLREILEKVLPRAGSSPMLGPVIHMACALNPRRV